MKVFPGSYVLALLGLLVDYPSLSKKTALFIGCATRERESHRVAQTMNKAVFLDRDGVINQKPTEGEYITSWEDFHILPGVADGIALLNQAGYKIVVVTNQRCVAKDQLSVTDLEKIHERMRRLSRELGQNSMEFITARTITRPHAIAGSPRLECF